MFYDYWRKLSFLSDISKILLLLILLFPPSSLFLQTPPIPCPKPPRETLWSLLAVLIWLMIWLTRLFLWIFLVSNLLCLPCVNVTRTSPSMPIVRRSQSTLSMIEVFLFYHLFIDSFSTLEIPTSEEVLKYQYETYQIQKRKEMVESEKQNSQSTPLSEETKEN